MSRPAPRWLSWLAIDEAHARQLRGHGGRRGTRDEHALEAALARPQHRWHYDTGSRLEDLAAAYAYGLVQGHPYVDGNKRVGLVAVVAFLDLNGVELVASDDEAVDAILQLASGRMTEAELAGWVRTHLR
ncbi:MAG: type II toxin-antitoxin system death-on-curing family toxin [Chloroflexota bacterium]